MLTLRRYWLAIILSIALLLILDGTISWLASCHPLSHYAGGSQNSDEKCSVFQGPLISLIIGITSFFETHDKGIVAAFTVILAVSTIGLWISTRNLYKAGEVQIHTSRKIAAIQAKQTEASIKEAIKAANAAEKSATASVAVERARLYVVVDHNFVKCINAAATWSGPIEQDERPLAEDAQPMAQIRFKNYGKTPGIVAEVGTEILYAEQPPDPVWDVKVVNANIIGPDDLTEIFPTVITGQMTMAQAKKVRSGEGHIWISGYVNYDDVFGERQVHRFFQRLVCLGHVRYALQAYDYKHYNKSS
jgi:hypothetical protein